MFMEDLDLYIFFLIMSLSGFGIRVMLASQNELEVFPLLLSSEKDYIELV